MDDPPVSDALDPGSTPDVPGADADSHGRFARLRERTDELEMFISGLLAFALLAVPGRIFDAWAVSEVHTDGIYWQALWFGFSTSVGLCYVLAIALIAHLAIRGYWVGLIGLKSNFPDGIRWDHIPFLGRTARGFYQARVVGLDQAITNADRAASTLFSTTLLFALTMAVIGLMSILAITVSAGIGALFPHSDEVALAILAVLTGVPVMLGLGAGIMDKAVARRHARGEASPRLERATHRVLALNQWFVPMRMLLPVQLMLQSNQRARHFMWLYMGAVMVAMVIGGVQAVGSMRFSLLDRYSLVTEAAVEQGMLSAHYESLRTEHDRLLRYPMIPADVIQGSRLRLFIPHQPKRENALAQRLCTLPDGGNTAAGPEAASRAVACLAKVWQVSLDGTPVPLDGFLPIERRDLEMRGLAGYLPLEGLSPGRHDLLLVWNADGGKRGRERRREYRIPFWYAPDDKG
ncbi:hypothetical protein G9274_001145 [Stenotrophomonas rhizophila]|nr:hypothetical protein G9274_001145 [Stenotrophomonas rhizophila]